MISTVQAIRNTFAKSAKRADSSVVQPEKLTQEEEALSTVREFRRNRVKTKPIPSQSTSVFD